MRLALISDIHSNYHALEAVLRDIVNQGVDRILCLGDVTLKGPLPKECVDEIRALGCPVVRGNTDECYHPDFTPERFPPRNDSQRATIRDFERHVQALSNADRQWLVNLPLNVVEHVEGLRLDFFHATPYHNYILLQPWATDEEIAQKLKLPADTAVAMFGHCHRPYVRQINGQLIVNVGSVGAPYDGDCRASYAILDVVEGKADASIIRVDYDAEAAIKAARDQGMAGWELFAHTVRRGEFPG